MKRLLLILLLMVTPLHAQTALETAAAALAAGSWTSLSTTNMSVFVAHTMGATNTINPYAMTMVWDSVRSQMHFLGADHFHPTGIHHVRYDMATNTWADLGLPSWYVAAEDNVDHGYDLTAINPDGRHLYHMEFNGNVLHIFDLDCDDSSDSDCWTSSTIPDVGHYTTNALEFFPDINSLAVLIPPIERLYFYSETTHLWTEGPALSGVSSSPSGWTSVTYDRSAGELTIQALNTHLYRYTSAGTLRTLSNWTSTYRDFGSTGYAGLWTTDPITGHDLILTDPENGTGRNVYDHDPYLDTYSLLTNQLPAKHLSASMIAGEIPELGITMWAWAASDETNGIYLYKSYPSHLSFTEKCAASGVITCQSFDSQSSLKYNYVTSNVPCTNETFIQPRYTMTLARGSSEGNVHAVEWNGACVYPLIDTSVKHSGAGSIKYTIPSLSGADTSGYFTLPFEGVGTSTYFGMGQTFYFQFYQYMDSTFLGTTYNPGDGWKQSIWYGNPPMGSSSSGIESTFVNAYLLGAPIMYGQQGSDDYGKQDVRACIYPGPYTAPPCVRYAANTWQEFTGRIDVGTISCFGGSPTVGDTRVRAWLDGKIIVDYPFACVNFDGSDGDGYGSYLLSPFMTGKDDTQVTPVGHTWYDDLIVSSQPIAMFAADEATGPVSFVTPVNGDTFNAGVFTNIMTIDSSISAVRVELWIDGKFYAKSDTHRTDTYNWYVRSKNLAGSHTLDIKAYDANGTLYTDTIAITVN